MVLEKENLILVKKNKFQKIKALLEAITIEAAP